MTELNVLNKEEALKNFFNAYSEAEDTLNHMSRIELLKYLGDFNESGNVEDVDSYSVNDTYIRVTASALGIEEHEFLIYALKHFNHI